MNEVDLDILQTSTVDQQLHDLNELQGRSNAELVATKDLLETFAENTKASPVQVAKLQDLKHKIEQSLQEEKIRNDEGKGPAPDKQAQSNNNGEPKAASLHQLRPQIKILRRPRL